MATGANEHQAKLDICRAVADRNIAMKVHLHADPTRQLGETVLNGINLSVPWNLAPNDFNWHRSLPSVRLRERWSIIASQPQETVLMFAARVGHLVDRTVRLIEVSSRDVTRILCGDGAAGITNE
jgi:hypothetical protein